MAQIHDEGVDLPKQPIQKFTDPIVRFMHVEAASGVVLLVCTVTALVLANTAAGEGFLAFWKTKVGFSIGSFDMFHSLKHWINDGLMAVFFFVVGLEVKREMVIGELKTVRGAALPVAAALGGMVLPAGIYLALQWGEPGARGWGIPMATDIAFVVGCMAVLGPRVPHIFRIMILSLAIVDDIGAILVIAIGYTESLDFASLILGFAGIGVVATIARLGVRSLGVYTALGVLIWIAFHESGVHATIAGVILGLQTPARSFASQGLLRQSIDSASRILHGSDWDTMTHRTEKVRKFRHLVRESVPPIEYLETTLHPWVSFLIMPIFALANAGVPITASDFTEPVAMAVTAGLVVGKPLGIFLFSWLVVKLFLKKLPEGLSWGMVLGGGCLAGIGFTMALFVTSLALKPPLLDAAKVGVLGGSAVAAVFGMVLLLLVLPKKPD